MTSEASEFEALPGLGAVAVVGGRRVLIGNQRLLESRGVPIDSLLAPAERLATEGATPVFVAVESQPAGLIAISDPVKASSAAAIAKLRSKGIQVVMLTGDRASTAQAVARKVGIDEVVAGVLPDGKETQRDECK